MKSMYITVAAIMTLGCGAQEPQAPERVDSVEQAVTGICSDFDATATHITGDTWGVDLLFCISGHGDTYPWTNLIAQIQDTTIILEAGAPADQCPASGIDGTDEAFNCDAPLVTDVSAGVNCEWVTVSWRYYGESGDSQAKIEARFEDAMWDDSQDPDDWCTLD